MFVLTDKKTGGVYANSKSGDEKGRKNVLVFAEKDDAERYIVLLEADDFNQELDILEVDTEIVAMNCGNYGYSYAIIEPTDLLIPKIKFDK
jgi:hypothetical protein